MDECGPRRFHHGGINLGRRRVVPLIFARDAACLPPLLKDHPPSICRCARDDCLGETVRDVRTAIMGAKRTEGSDNGEMSVNLCSSDSHGVAAADAGAAGERRLCGSGTPSNRQSLVTISTSVGTATWDVRTRFGLRLSSEIHQTSLRRRRASRPPTRNQR